MKVVITNTAALNTGDAAILEATGAMLQMAFGADTSIAIHDISDAPARYYPELSFRGMAYDSVEGATRGKHRRRLTAAAVLLAARTWHTRFGQAIAARLPRDLRDILADFADADLIVSAGGTYLVPHYRIAPKLFELMLAHAFGKPLVLFTQSLGPFGKRDRLLLGRALRGAKLILVRDEKSRHHLLDLAVQPFRIRVCADAAFAICPGDIVRRARAPRTDSPVHVAISARDWTHFSDGDGAARMGRYIDAMAVLTYRLITERQARVTFLSTCQGAPEYWTDDSVAAGRIVKRLPAAVRDRVSIDKSFHRPLDLLDRLEHFDFVVATRMHAAILALCAGVPVIPIAYEFKTVELFRWLGFTEPIPDMETLTPDSLWADFEQISNRWVTDHKSLWRRVGGARESALSAVDCLKRSIPVAP